MDLLKKLKMRLLPPSSKSFHSRMNALTSLVSNRDNHLEWLEYTVLHQSMEERLRRKIELGKRVKVIFIIQYAAKFECKSVYDAMKKSDLFDPYILITHPRDKMFLKEPVYFQEAKAAFALFTERGYKTIFGYDEFMRPIGLEQINPDIVFWNNPNMYDYSHYQNIYLNANYLTCFIPYFFNCAHLKDPARYAYSCENYQSNTVWKIFSECYSSFYQLIEKKARRALRPSQYVAINSVLSGYPKLDAYTKEDQDLAIPEKIDNGKPIVIYAPHWSIRVDTQLSTFHLFNQHFLQLVKDNPAINFVFKPHPDLLNRLIDLKNAGRDYTLSPEQYEAYIEEWSALPNGVYVNDGEYIDLFKKSTCLITDSGSFIAEYLPSGHPCIYILNPEKTNPLDFYSELGRRIIESYYCCSDWDTIERYFKDVVINKNDPNKELRRQIVKEEFINIGTAGQFICDYLTQLLTD
ncbi:CDP-glycerol glycerophosphotransferase family protein [Harryflintia acetispora]|uniref:CDP-glycerol glycerophosphotransferase family protein n=1 Tax=Harryflintia acetispora TaxID=1849041 RepID=UPI001896C992